MDDDVSITRYIAELKRGDEKAAQRIWACFMTRLIQLADRKLAGSPRQTMNEEDVVQHAFVDFFKQVEENRFAKLFDRNDLWQILAMLVDRRAKDQIRKLKTKKSGNGRVFSIEDFGPMPRGNDIPNGIGSIEDFAPTPDLAIQFSEEFDRLLGKLENEEYKSIAIQRMQGFSNREIATKLNSSLRTIERRLDQIRLIWRSELRNER